MSRAVLTGTLALGLITLGLGPFAAAPAAAAKPNIYHTISSTHAGATLDQTEGCTRTEVFVSSSVAMYAAQPGPVNKQGLTGVFVRVTDVCATAPDAVKAAAGGGSVMFEADGQNMATLVVDSRLQRASIDTVLPGTDDRDQPVSIALHATWTASGPLVHSTEAGSFHTEEGNMASHDNNLARPVVADVSLRVTGEEVDRAVAGTASEATLERTKSMCIEVPRPGVTEFFPCFGFPG